MKCHFTYFSILISLVTTSALAGSANVNWPADYKRKFTHYFSGDRTANHQIIRLYANDAAITGVQANGKLPNGSVVVGELYAAEMEQKSTCFKRPWPENYQKPGGNCGNATGRWV